ncbi:WxL domain-containing protein [Enterococcus faecalis]|uniref:WxL domain-containing protein n=1 Tax=Enterococcus faecalis TaxID=1351 RepID=UPI0035E6226E
MKSIRLLGATLLASTTLLGAASAFAAPSEPSTPEPASAQTPVSATLTVNETPTRPVPPTGPEGGTDTDTGITGLFGIAYAPNALQGSAQLNEKDSTEVSLASTGNTSGKYNVGVQDKTRAKDRNWTLSAQLEWTGANKNYMDGATITATNGTVQLNTNGNLSGLADAEVTTTAANLTISQDAPVEIMTAQKGKTMNGVYNYQFQAPKLVIPQSQNVTAGTYSGNINWTLSNVVE